MTEPADVLPWFPILSGIEESFCIDEWIMNRRSGMARSLPTTGLDVMAIGRIEKGPNLSLRKDRRADGKVVLPDDCLGSLEDVDPTVALDRCVVRAHELHAREDHRAAAAVWRDGAVPMASSLHTVDRSVISACASSGLLKAGDVEGALHFARAAVADRRTSWPLYRLGLALTAMGHYEEAVEILYEGQFLLPVDQTHTLRYFQEAISSALIGLHPAVRLAFHDTYQRVLVASRRIPIGGHVLTEQPILRWKATREDSKAGVSKAVWRYNAAEGDGLGDITKAPPEEGSIDTIDRKIAEVCYANGFSPSIADIVKPFIGASDTKRRLILSCVTPHIPPGAPLIAMCTLAAQLAILPLCRDASLSEETVLKLLMINKVNAHRVADTDTAIFLTASKFTHSCEPNCLYDGYNLRYTALRDIEPGEVLTFAYHGGNSLIQGSEVRQVSLSHTHLFICQCKRCAGIDYGRGIKCVLPCRGTRYRTQTWQLDHLNCRKDGYQPWSCVDCRRSWTDQEMPLMTEDKIEGASMSCEGSKSKVDKNQYEDIKKCLLKCMSELGSNHWVYLKLTSLMARYHINVARTVSRTLGEHSLTLAVQWGLKHLGALEAQKVTLHCDIIAAEYGNFLFDVCHDLPRLRRHKVRLASAFAARFAAIFPWREQEISRHRALLDATTLLHLDPDALCHPEIEVEEDEEGLFTAWEETLTTKYLHAMARSTATMGGNTMQEAHVQSILQEGTLPVIPKQQKT